MNHKFTSPLGWCSYCEQNKEWATDQCPREIQHPDVIDLIQDSLLDFTGGGWQFFDSNGEMVKKVKS